MPAQNRPRVDRVFGKLWLDGFDPQNDWWSENFAPLVRIGSIEDGIVPTSCVVRGDTLAAIEEIPQQAGGKADPEERELAQIGAEDRVGP
ncbi:MAG: hypothetical protein JRH10_14075 [Deltaproteobacteria bacterium]|nr:hypothetical protein [Deltaproteobacteria bacterium]MBW2446999.1 hypothetical protein [Deltaproteobacteria bacterium]